MMTGTGRCLSAVVVLCFGACQQTSLPRSEEATSRPAPISCKPEAPIEIQLSTRPLAPGELELAVRATPTTDVDSVVVGVVAPPHATLIGTDRVRFGPTSAGTTREVVARLHADRRPATLAAFARVPVDGVVMARSAQVAIGDPAPAARTRTYALPDGDRARELRP
jgi:hypothetical protein